MENENENTEQLKEDLKDKFVQGAKEAMKKAEKEPLEENPYAEVDGDVDEKDKGPTGFEEIDGVEEEEISEDVDSDESSGDADTDADEDSGDEQTEAIGQDLLFRAAQAGLSYEETQAFGTPQALEAAIALKQGSTKSGKTGTDGEDGEQSNAGVDGLNPFGEFQEIPFEVPEDLDEEEVELFRSQNEKFNAAMKAQHEMMSKVFQEIKGSNERLQQEQDLRFARDFDKQVVNLGSDWVDTIGSGSMDELAQDSAYANNRTKIFREVLNLRNSHPEWEMEQLFNVAVGITFPEQTKRSTVNQAKQRTDEFKQKRTTARPAKRTQPTIRNKREEAKKSLFSGLKKLMGKN